MEKFTQKESKKMWEALNHIINLEEEINEPNFTIERAKIIAKRCIEEIKLGV